MSPQALHVDKKLKFALKNKNNNLKILRYKFIKKAILKRKVFRAFLKQPAESHTLSSRGRAFQS